MTIYIVLIVLIFIQAFCLSFISKAISKKIFLILAFAEIVFISGLRKSVGGDTEVYIDFFKTIANMSYYDILTYGFDTGFMMFCYLLSKISTNPQILIFASSFVITALVFKYIYFSSKITWLSVYLYITLLYFFHFMNLMRFGMATAILLQSIQYIEGKKLFKFIICVLIAGSFHSSAFLFIFTYIFGRITITKRKILIAVALCALSVYFVKIFFATIVIFAPRYFFYMEFFNNYQGNLANYIIFGIYLCMLILAVLYDTALKKNVSNKREIHESNTSLWLLACGVGFSIAAIPTMIMVRFTIMFTIVCISYIPNLLIKIRNKDFSNLLFFNLLSISFAYNIIVLIYRPDWFLVTPYINILFE